MSKSIAETVKKEDKENYKFLIIGGNTPEVSKKIIKVVEEEKDKIVVFELTHFEIKNIVRNRFKARAEKSAVDYLEKKENIQKAKQQCLDINKMYFGKPDISEVIDKKRLKILTSASWKQINDHLNTLDLFGMIVWVDNKKRLFKLIVDDTLILNNKLNELEQILKLAEGKVSALSSDKKYMSEETKKTLTKLKCFLKTKRKWNSNN